MLHLSVINYIGREDDHALEITRPITVVRGIPFYCSSGENSKAKGTWFPFFGLEANPTERYKLGYFHKPQNSEELPTELVEMLQRLFHGQVSPTRFGTLPGLLISSQLGGGMWESTAGKTLKAHLQNTYPSFYQNWPGVGALSLTQLFFKGQEHQVNQWLMKQCEMEDREKLRAPLFRPWDHFGIEELPAVVEPIIFIDIKQSALLKRRQLKRESAAKLAAVEEANELVLAIKGSGAKL